MGFEIYQSTLLRYSVILNIILISGSNDLMCACLCVHLHIYTMSDPTSQPTFELDLLLHISITTDITGPRSPHECVIFSGGFPSHLQQQNSCKGLHTSRLSYGNWTVLLHRPAAGRTFVTKSWLLKSCNLCMNQKSPVYALFYGIC